MSFASVDIVFLAGDGQEEKSMYREHRILLMNHMAHGFENIFRFFLWKNCSKLNVTINLPWNYLPSSSSHQSSHAKFSCTWKGYNDFVKSRSTLDKNSAICVDSLSDTASILRRGLQLFSTRSAEKKIVLVSWGVPCWGSNESQISELLFEESIKVYFWCFPSVIPEENYSQSVAELSLKLAEHPNITFIGNLSQPSAESFARNSLSLCRQVDEGTHRSILHLRVGEYNLSLQKTLDVLLDTALVQQEEEKRNSEEMELETVEVVPIDTVPENITYGNTFMVRPNEDDGEELDDILENGSIVQALTKQLQLNHECIIARSSGSPHDAGRNENWGTHSIQKGFYILYPCSNVTLFLKQVAVGWQVLPLCSSRKYPSKVDENFGSKLLDRIPHRVFDPTDFNVDELWTSFCSSQQFNMGRRDSKVKRLDSSVSDKSSRPEKFRRIRNLLSSR